MHLNSYSNWNGCWNVPVLKTGNFTINSSTKTWLGECNLNAYLYRDNFTINSLPISIYRKQCSPGQWIPGNELVKVKYYWVRMSYFISTDYYGELFGDICNW